MVDVLVEVRAPLRPRLRHALEDRDVARAAPRRTGGVARAGGRARSRSSPSSAADPFGHAAVATLAAEGVDVSGVARTDRPTGTVVALVEPDGQRSMLTDRGANLALDAEHGRAGAATSLAGRLDHVHVSGYCLLDDATRPAGRRRPRRRRRARCVALGRRGLGRPAARDGPAAASSSSSRGCDYLFCNLEEGAGSVRPRGRRRRRSRRSRASFGEVVCTLGARRRGRGRPATARSIGAAAPGRRRRRHGRRGGRVRRDVPRSAARRRRRRRRRSCAPHAAAADAIAGRGAPAAGAAATRASRGCRRRPAVGPGRRGRRRRRS